MVSEAANFGHLTKNSSSTTWSTPSSQINVRHYFTNQNCSSSKHAEDPARMSDSPGRLQRRHPTLGHSKLTFWFILRRRKSTSPGDTPKTAVGSYKVRFYEFMPRRLKVFTSIVPENEICVRARIPQLTHSSKLTGRLWIWGWRRWRKPLSANASNFITVDERIETETLAILARFKIQGIHVQ